MVIRGVNSLFAVIGGKRRVKQICLPVHDHYTETCMMVCEPAEPVEAAQPSVFEGLARDISLWFALNRPRFVLGLLWSERGRQ